LQFRREDNSNSPEYEELNLAERTVLSPPEQYDTTMRRRHSRLNFTGSLHFVTLVTLERGRWFVAEPICSEILRVFEAFRRRFELQCFGYVLMPDHLHAILQQNGEGARVPDFVMHFKRLTGRQIHPDGYPPVALWRETYDDVALPGSKAVQRRISYMIGNPIRANLGDGVTPYRWSSAGNCGIVTVSDL
jgi:REP element-mobilizing transposase RayT